MVGSTKTPLHCSKAMHTVYEAQCRCRVKYIGEMHRNLKVRLMEHTKRNSDSALTDHLFSDLQDHFRKLEEKVHRIMPKRTLVLAQERHPLKRKILETISIKTRPENLCNTGLSIELESSWNPCLEHVQREQKKRKWIDNARGE